MRKFSHLLVSLTFIGWTAAANATLQQEIFFYFPGDGTTVDNFRSSTRPSPLLPAVTVTLPTPSGLCISPCWDIGIKPSNSNPVSRAGQTPGSPAPGGQQGSPTGDGPGGFDPQVITEELFEEDSNNPPPFTPVITDEDELPPGTQGEGQGGENGEGGEGGGENSEGGEGGGGGGNGIPGDEEENFVDYCGPETPLEESCTQGSASNGTVPLPSTLLLFGIGLLGLARIRRRHC